MTSLTRLFPIMPEGAQTRALVAMAQSIYGELGKTLNHTKPVEMLACSKKIAALQSHWNSASPRANTAAPALCFRDQPARSANDGRRHHSGERAGLRAS
jgi:hypothetical protein